MTLPNSEPCEGILLVDKPKGKTAFDLVAILRKLLHVRVIGHAGTLDPMATGVMVMLVGRRYTRLSNQLLGAEKEYIGQIHLGIETDTYDAEGKPVSTSEKVPTHHEVTCALETFQGQILQVPPMYSAKKIKGQKLYHLARQGKKVERPAQSVQVKIELLAYTYPYVHVHIICSKGAYVRSIAHDLGQLLGCGAHLSSLIRTRSGSYKLSECLKGEKFYNNELTSLQLREHLLRTLKD